MTDKYGYAAIAIATGLVVAVAGGVGFGMMQAQSGPAFTPETPMAPARLTVPVPDGSADRAWGGETDGSAAVSAPAGARVFNYPVQRQCWSRAPTTEDRPDVTCVSLTDDVLRSLLGQSADQVDAIMGVPGRRHEHAHFVSNARMPDDQSGVVNVIYDTQSVAQPVAVDVVGYHAPSSQPDQRAYFDFKLRDGALPWIASPALAALDVTFALHQNPCRLDVAMTTQGLKAHQDFWGDFLASSDGPDAEQAMAAAIQHDPNAVAIMIGTFLGGVMGARINHDHRCATPTAQGSDQSAPTTADAGARSGSGGGGGGGGGAAEELPDYGPGALIDDRGLRGRVLVRQVVGHRSVTRVSPFVSAAPPTRYRGGDGPASGEDAEEVLPATREAGRGARSAFAAWTRHGKDSDDAGDDDEASSRSGHRGSGSGTHAHMARSGWGDDEHESVTSHGSTSGRSGRRR